MIWVQSLECMLHVEVQLVDALPDVLQGPVGVLLLEEEMRMQGVDHYLDWSHINDAVVQVLVQPGHMMEEEELVHMDWVARQNQLPRPDSQPKQILDDLLFSLFGSDAAVETVVVEARGLMVAIFSKIYVVFH